MRLLPSRRVSGRAWWGLFALLIAAPALALAWLGLRAVRAERLEAEQQLRAQQRQLAQLADAAIRNVLVQLETAIRRDDSGRPGDGTSAPIPSDATPMVFQRFGLVTFPRDRVYFGPFGRQPAERVRLTDWSTAVAAMIDAAQAAEIQRRTPEALRLLSQVARADPRLEAWAAIVSARTRLQHDPRALAQLARSDWARASGVTPSGLPAAFVASAAVDSRPAAERPAFLPLIRATLDELHAGRWWLSADERRFYDTQLRAFLERAGVPAPPRDVRLDALAEIDQIVRQSPPSRRNGSTYALERGPTSAALVVWAPSDADGDAWIGAAVNQADAASLIGPPLERLFAGQAFTGAIRDGRGTNVWTPATTGPFWHSEPLIGIAGWNVAFTGPGDRAALSRRQWLWYGFVVLLLVMLLAGIGMTAQVVQREMELARMQAEFVGAVTHEFKSPITSIRLLLERVAGGRVATPAAAATYYSAIGQETDRLERLVNRLLDAQQIEAGQRRYAFTSESLDAVAGDVVRHLQPIADAKNIRIDVDTSAELPPVHIDRAAITDAIENLVDNAIKYSRSGTQILVRLHAAGDRVSVEVADQGIGIERDELARVFDKFYRARRGDLESVRGTGLGLALVKAAAEAHGGTVDVESQPGVGSRFTLQLPSATAPSAEASDVRSAAL
jgi:signal transduction histidine kinase